MKLNFFSRDIWAHSWCYRVESNLKLVPLLLLFSSFHATGKISRFKALVLTDWVYLTFEKISEGTSVSVTALLFWGVTPCGLVSRNILSILFLKMEAIRSYETLVCTYESTRCHNPERHRHIHRRENLKRQVFFSR
jgi:hypothetical protein